MAEPLIAQACGRAALAHIEGRFADARHHYAEAAEQMRRTGSLHAGIFHQLALLTVAFSDGDLASAQPLARQVHDTAGPLAADAWAATLAAAGQPDEARAAIAERVPIRRDFFHSVFATLRAMAAIGLGDRAAARPLISELAPAAGMIAGAASGSLVMAPVDLTLGELCLLAGLRERAAGYFAGAEQVARRWNSPHWAARARARAARAG